MALFRDDSGKTEQATPMRLNEARNRGQTGLSREFTMAGTLLVAVVLLRTAGPWLIGRLEQNMRLGFDVAGAARRLGDGEVNGAIQELLRHCWIVAPPFVLLLVCFVLGTAVFGYGQIGLRWSTQALGIKWERIDPMRNLNRLFSLASVARTALSALKLSVLALVPWLLLRARWRELANLHGIEDLPLSLGLIADLALTAFTWIAIVVLVLSLGDIAWQRFDFNKQLMMSKQEVEDERKRTDGDPMIKSRQRSLRMEMMRQRMMEAIPKADVVITNPTHFAVALKYDRTRHTAPEVVAKGLDDLALRIRELAAQHRVPIMEDPPLARGLYRAVKVGQQVPEKFYQAVAAVLSHIYRLRGRVA